jgi:hypothetical protein
MSNNLNFSSTVPAAPSGFQNVVFQTDPSGDLSAYVPVSSVIGIGTITEAEIAASSLHGAGPTLQTFLGSSAVAGNVAIFSTDGSIIDSGVPATSSGVIGVIAVNGTAVYGTLFEVNGVPIV